MASALSFFPFVRRRFSSIVESHAAGVYGMVQRQTCSVGVSTKAHHSFADFIQQIQPPAHCLLTFRAFTSTYERASYAAEGDDEAAEEQQQRDRKFIDKRRVAITAGNGGSGAVSFMKDGGSKMRRGADGGNGGDGAGVWIQALRHVKGLGDTPFRVAAENGGKGGKQGSHGRRGKEVELRVPVGTVVWKEIVDIGEKEELEIDDGRIDFSNWGTPNPVANDDDDDADADADDYKAEGGPQPETQRGTRPRGVLKGNWEILCDLNEHGSRFRLAKGGRGGKGNKAKPKGKLAATRDLGTEGEKLTVILELKSVADVGLVGLPNAGKSTLLRAISGARPNVADYAFTTMQPQLGAVKTDGGLSSIVVADIPGLIEGAHENRGLGHNFLRHVERCSAFIFVVDLSSGMGDKPGTAPWEALDILRAELEAYLPGLSERPSLVVGTKTDIEHTSEVADVLRRKTHLPVITVSANESRGIKNMLLATEELLRDTETSQ